MLTVLTKNNWSGRGDLIEKMFRLRYQVLYEQLAWEQLYSEDGLDRDASDHAETIYLVGTSSDTNSATSCIRFAPSVSPTLSKLVFPHLFDVRELPISPTVYDASRIVADRTRHLFRMGSPLGEILVGWQEAGLALGIEAFTGVAEVNKFRKLMAIGWKIAPMGLPQQCGDSEVLAVKITPTQDAIERTRKHFGFDRPAIDDAGLDALKKYHKAFLAEFARAQAA